MNYSKRHLNQKLQASKQSLRATYFPLSNIHTLLWLPTGKVNRRLCLQQMYSEVTHRHGPQCENQLKQDRGKWIRRCTDSYWHDFALVLNLLLISWIIKLILKNVQERRLYKQVTYPIPLFDRCCRQRAHLYCIYFSTNKTRFLNLFICEVSRSENQNSCFKKLLDNLFCFKCKNLDYLFISTDLCLAYSMHWLNHCWSNECWYYLLIQ